MVLEMAVLVLVDFQIMQRSVEDFKSMTNWPCILNTSIRDQLFVTWLYYATRPVPITVLSFQCSRHIALEGASPLKPQVLSCRTRGVDSWCMILVLLRGPFRLDPDGRISISCISSNRCRDRELLFRVAGPDSETEDPFSSSLFLGMVFGRL
jgi:hypothetical protein